MHAINCFLVERLLCRGWHQEANFRRIRDQMRAALASEMAAGDTTAARMRLNAEQYAHAASTVNTRFWTFEDPDNKRQIMTMCPLLGAQ